jgi:hypothetical protein
MEYQKLTRDDPGKTKINAGHSSFSVEQLEEEMNMDTEIGKRLKSVEKILEENY